MIRMLTPKLSRKIRKSFPMPKNAWSQTLGCTKIQHAHGKRWTILTSKKRKTTICIFKTRPSNQKNVSSHKTMKNMVSSHALTAPVHPQSGSIFTTWWKKIDVVWDLIQSPLFTITPSLPTMENVSELMTHGWSFRLNHMMVESLNTAKNGTTSSSNKKRIQSKLNLRDWMLK